MPDQLDKALDVFISWQTAFICFGAYGLTIALRKLVELVVWKTATTNILYNEILLPAAPIGNGILLVLIAKNFPLPVVLASSFMAKVIYGGICGVASGWVYARFRGWAKAKIGLADSIRPPAPAPVPPPADDPPVVP